MSMIVKGLLAGGLIVSPLFATAPASATTMNDAAYCQALIKKYFTFAPAHRREMAGTVDVNVAIEQCKAGNTAAGIPVLERTLRDAKLDLPSRDEPPAKP